MRSASPIIARFLSQIKSANRAKTTSLQKQLITGLQKITIYYRCYLRKLQLVRYVTDECKKGTASMQDLYNTGVRSFGSNNNYCIIKNGLQYTHFRDVEKLVVADSKQHRFDSECLLNNQAKKDQVCRYKNDGYTVQQTASKVQGMDVRLVEMIYKTCPEMPISPLKKEQICSLRNRGLSDVFISNIVGVTVSRLKNVKC